MEKKCSICKKITDSETAGVLAVGGYGNVKYICSECDGDFAAATESRDYEEIVCAMERISKKIDKSNVDDELVMKTVKDVMSEAGERAKKIKEGILDFSAQEDEEEEIGVPEELLETEEDRLLDEKENEKNKKADKITNIVCLVVFIALFGFAVYRIIASFL